MTSAELKNYLIRLLTDPDNEWGGRVLGTYTLPGGSVLPAVADHMVPDDWLVNGVEVIIPVYPESRSEWRRARKAIYQNWALEVVQHEVTEGNALTLQQCVDRLERCFVQSQVIPILPNDKLGILPQVRFSFPAWDTKPIINRVVDCS